MAMFSARLDAAVAFAAKAHASQVRKGTDIPYITHPFSVAVLLLQAGLAEEVAIAGLLHDVVEDTEVSIEEVRRVFGARVAELVGAVTERKREGGVERPWEDRKREALSDLENASLDAVALKVADALHNVCTTAIALRDHGPSVWSRFKRGPRESCWYYGEIARLARERLGDDGLAQELAQAVEALRQMTGSEND